MYLRNILCLGVAPSMTALSAHRAPLQSPHQCLGWVQGAAAGCMFDLLSAGNAGRDYNRGGIVFDCREKPPASYRNRDVVMLFFIAKRTRHAAASGINFLDWICQR